MENNDPEGGRISITPGANPGHKDPPSPLFWPAADPIIPTPYRQNPWMPGGSGSKAHHRFVEMPNRRTVASGENRI
ncbi:hypothetical protein [Lunatimonas lonarensis]|nr:hypothetical protein [Lunatimonas lonarensis]